MRMKHISSHIKRAASNTRETERGELMRYFLDRLNAHRLADGYPKMTMGRIGKALQQIPTKDLYYLKSVCDRAPNFSKRFWYELNPEKYERKQQTKYPGNGSGM